MTVYVVLERRPGLVNIVGVYATEEIAREAADSVHAGFAGEVIPCDVLDQAP